MRRAEVNAARDLFRGCYLDVAATQLCLRLLLLLAVLLWIIASL